MILSLSEFTPVSSEEELVDLYNSYQFQNQPSKNFYGGIIFDQDFDEQENGKVPKLNYKIRFGSSYTSTETKFIFPFIQLSGPGKGESFYAQYKASEEVWGKFVV